MPTTRQNKERKRVLAFDPGENTGAVVVDIFREETDLKFAVVAHSTLEFSEEVRKGFIGYTHLLQTFPDLALIEQVLAHGLLTADKIIQARAAERAFVYACSGVEEIHWQLPEIRKRAEQWLPEAFLSLPLTDRHQRDAFAHTVAWGVMHF